MRISARHTEPFRKAGIALRMLGAVLGMALLGVVLFGGTGEVAPEDGKVHLRYWYVVGAQDAVPYHARRFNEVQDSIVVEASPIPWQEHEKKILTAVLSGDPPDVVSQFIPVVKWASRMALTPLDDFITRDGFDSTIVFPALWGEMKWQGRTFALPVNSTSYALFYNRALFREAGIEAPPRTWDELREIAGRLTTRDGQGRIQRMGFVPDYGNLPTTSLMAWQQGAQFLSQDGTRVRLATPETVEAMEWIADYYRSYGVRDVKGFVAGLGTADQHGFLSGRLAMAVLDMSFLDGIARYAPDLDFGVAMIPSFDGVHTASSAGSWWLAIPRGARHPEAAWAFMRFALDAQTQLEEVEHTEDDLFPANREAAADPRFMKDEVVEVFVQQMEFAHSPTVVPLAHDVFWREFYGAQERVIHGRQGPEEALRQAERIVQGSLDRARAYDAYVRANMDFEPTGEGRP